MIKESTIRRVMALVSVVHPDTEFSALEAQLMRSLRVYQDRGEFDGTYNSACKCLLQAGYELVGFKELD